MRFLFSVIEHLQAVNYKRHIHLEVNGLYKYIFKKTMNINLGEIPVFPYDEAMSRVC